MGDSSLAQITVVILISFSLIMIGIILSRPAILHSRAGKIITFLAIFILPGICAVTGYNVSMNNATKVEFCMSCHEMEVYGKSLTIDDDEYFVANHNLNNRLPNEYACFTCHTSYTMFGNIESKYRGLKHLYVHYFGTIPDTIKLYSKFQNRECLHCHSGAKDYILTDAHNETETMLNDLKKDKISCIQSGCHDVAHEVHEFDGLDFWEDNK